MSGLDFSDDEVLVKALIAREPDAFAHLIDTYHPALVRLAQQYVPSRAVAEEVAQETWVAVIEGIGRFERRSSLKTWLYRILANIARTHGVRESRSIPFASSDAFSDPAFTDEPAVAPSRFRRCTLHARGTWKLPPQAWNEPEQQALDGEMLDIVGRAVERLAPAQREVITMRDLLGWSAVEVCDALEITDANQRVLLHRARSNIRSVLERHYDGGRGQ